MLEVDERNGSGAARRGGEAILDDDFGQGLPDLADKIHPDLRMVTLDQLFAHRAGLWSKNSPKVASLKELLETEKLGKTPRQQRHAFWELVVQETPVFPPGSRFAYAGRGYVLAGAMMEQVADASWEQLMTERLFKPLGMTTAGFGSMGTADEIDQPWQHRVAKDGKRTPLVPGPFSDNPPAIAPVGTIHCSIGDWARYTLVQLQGANGKSQFLKPESFKHLHTPQFGDGYASGWYVSKDGTLSHTGSNGGNFAMISIMPRTNFAVMIATNQGGEVATQACSDLPGLLLARCARNQ